jgi:peptide/nickel transport system permease protein
MTDVVLDEVIFLAPPRSLRSILRENPLLTAAAALGLVLVLGALFAPLIAPYPGDAGSATHPLSTFLPPSLHHLFGTDQVGRDLFSRVLYGARISLLVAAVVIGFSILIGLPLGVIAGALGGVADTILMRITDIFLAFPALLLALALTSALTPSVTNATIAIAITWWPWYARLARGQAASVAGRPFIAACRALGLSPARTIVRHVLPNSLTPVIVQASADVGGVILTAAALSFLGLGAQDPTPEWGLMVNQGQAYFTTQWWLVTFPGAAILLTALAFNLLGDGLRDVLDPRRVVERR